MNLMAYGEGGRFHSDWQVATLASVERSDWKLVMGLHRLCRCYREEICASFGKNDVMSTYIVPHLRLLILLLVGLTSQ